MRPEGWALVAIVVVALLLFGAPKLPGLARSVGQSLRIFKSEVKQMKDDGPSEAADDGAPVEGRVVPPARSRSDHPDQQGPATPGQHNPPGPADPTSRTP
ncbi:MULTISPECIES: Sec-independent protein translocase subunit TatA [unclassified Arthrobacter]|uniref:Sec-independent protein translocase subunit TatA n=1 Tax=unclassified Arthrobacter TaxID=235627 RepID=UPI0014931AC6|nr:MULTISPECIES: Sec-independent protein translocase subunit TatA [unclassified Arthrobacter]MBE0010660.1 twin-arginine translocase TatA/TatE family subunit [Arthrobacter sp. AET 35A]NOJ59611.1 Sec-independent protein translocase subunit TatA [Arthrobacter sp. 260]NOJ64521.1 Sec-independent protein translocase subunit TatA [Arthrobacter sp. 147(2020)]